MSKVSRERVGIELEKMITGVPGLPDHALDWPFTSTDSSNPRAAPLYCWCVKSRAALDFPILYYCPSPDMDPCDKRGQNLVNIPHTYGLNTAADQLSSPGAGPDPVAAITMLVRLRLFPAVFHSPSPADEALGSNYGTSCLSAMTSAHALLQACIRFRSKPCAEIKELRMQLCYMCCGLGCGACTPACCAAQIRPPFLVFCLCLGMPCAAASVRTVCSADDGIALYSRCHSHAGHSDKGREAAHAPCGPAAASAAEQSA